VYGVAGEDLSRLKQAYCLQEDVYAHRHTTSFKGTLDEVEEEKQCLLK